MNGLEKIAEQIRMQVQQEADALIQQAQREADALRAAAEEEAAQEAVRFTEQAQADRATERARALASAEANGRRVILTEKQYQIAEVIEAALQQLEQLPNAEYFALMLRLADQYCLPEDGQIVFSARDLARMPADFSEKLQQVAAKHGGTLRVSDETRKLGSGFMLIYGGIEQNCALRALFDAQREQLQDLVNRALFA